MASTLNAASRFGNEIAVVTGLAKSTPIDPLKVVECESHFIVAHGDNFADAFDGRLEYDHPLFVLFYNTKYDHLWPHRGEHHPKVHFTIAHELGHYFLERHRRYLLKARQPHNSEAEFVADNFAEREADCFAAGLLMPETLLRPRVNKRPPSIPAIRNATGDYHVSFTSMLVRWIQLCDFPCAMACVQGGNIKWGFISEGFAQKRIFALKRATPLGSSDALEFYRQESALKAYREGSGWGITSQWFDSDHKGIEVNESYLVVPSTQQMLILLTASEDDLPEASDDD